MIELVYLGDREAGEQRLRNRRRGSTAGILVPVFRSATTYCRIDICVRVFVRQSLVQFVFAGVSWRKRIYLGFGEHDCYWFIIKRRVCRAAAPRPLRAVRGYSVRAAYAVAANRTRGGVGVKRKAASEEPRGAPAADRRPLGRTGGRPRRAAVCNPMAARFIALRRVNEAANGLDHKSRLTMNTLFG